MAVDTAITVAMRTTADETGSARIRITSGAMGVIAATGVGMARAAATVTDTSGPGVTMVRDESRGTTTWLLTSKQVANS